MEATGDAAELAMKLYDGDAWRACDVENPGASLPRTHDFTTRKRRVELTRFDNGKTSTI